MYLQLLSLSMFAFSFEDLFLAIYIMGLCVSRRRMRVGGPWVL